MWKTKCECGATFLSAARELIEVNLWFAALAPGTGCDITTGLTDAHSSPRFTYLQTVCLRLLRGRHIKYTGCLHCLFFMRRWKCARQSPLGATDDLFSSIFSCFRNAKGCANVSLTCCRCYRSEAACQREGWGFASTVIGPSVDITWIVKWKLLCKYLPLSSPTEQSVNWQHVVSSDIRSGTGFLSRGRRCPAACRPFRLCGFGGVQVLVGWQQSDYLSKKYVACLEKNHARLAESSPLWFLFSISGQWSSS